MQWLVVFILMHVINIKVTWICSINESVFKTKWSELRNIADRWGWFVLNLTIDGISSIAAHFAVNTVNSNADVWTVEAMTWNCQVLTTIGESWGSTEIKDNRDCLYLITWAVIIRAVRKLLVCICCIACFPKHFDAIIVANWKLSNLASYSVISPATECSELINLIFEIEFWTSDFNIDESSLLFSQVIDDITHGFRIKP